MQNLLTIPLLTVLSLVACKKQQSADPVIVTPPHIVNVSTATELKNALLDAAPGDEIVMADGVYNGKFVIDPSRDGTLARPITLRGSRNAVLDAGDINTGYVLHLQADYWTLQGFTITNGLKGIMTDGANHDIIDGVRVYQIGEEGIHLRTFSSNNVIRNVEISYTGLKTPDYGEGIYIGSAKNNWPTYTSGNPDKSDANQVMNCQIGPYVAAECIDIKEGTTGGTIRDNHFDATGISGANGADSWIDVKGNGYSIESNDGSNPGGSIFKDGYQVHVAVQGWGNDNSFKQNSCVVNATGYGFNIQLSGSNGTSTGNVVYTSNIVSGAAAGVSNIPLHN